MQATPPDRNAICHDICAFLSSDLDHNQARVAGEAGLHELNVDSYTLMQVILFIERKYGIELPVEILTPDAVASVESLSARLHEIICNSAAA